MGRLQQVLDLPAFLLGVFYLYWSVPLSVLQGKLQFYNFSGKRDDALAWAQGISTMFHITVLQLPGPGLYHGEGVIYLANHRCWADFFLDVIFTDGRAQMLSRMAVLIVFPAFMISVWYLKAVVLFVRGGRVDKEKFNDMLDKKIEESPLPGLIVYPEGHRSLKRESLPLKRGMLHYCYDRKHTVQIVMTANKEAVLSEKQLRAHFRQKVLLGYSDPVHPGDYASFDAFMAEVQSRWDAEWKRVYGADWARASVKKPLSLKQRNYPTSIKVSMAITQGLSCLAFFVTLYWTTRGTAAFLRLLGPYRGVVTALLVIWLAISVVRALVPVRLPRPAAAGNSK